MENVQLPGDRLLKTTEPVLSVVRLRLTGAVICTVAPGMTAFVAEL